MVETVRARIPTTRVAAVALTGTSVEWYDFFIYGTAAALVFPQFFFPESMSPALSLLAAFGTFAVGFLARPLGGILFGHYGDRHGRKGALIVSLVMMGLSTGLIGLLPSYEAVGALAPLLLVLLRFVQGLALGGQWGGAVLLLTETAPKNKRAFYGSFAQAGGPIGLILANLAFLLVSVLVSSADFLTWGWRIPFLLGAGLIALAYYSRSNLEDSPVFQQLAQLKEEQERKEAEALAAASGKSVSEVRAARDAERQPSPVIEVLRTYPREIALAAGTCFGHQISSYIFYAFVVAYGSSAAGLGLPRNIMLGAVLIGSVLMTPAILISAALSDKYGRRGVFMLGAALLALWGFAVFPLINTASFLWITVGIATGQVFIAMMYGPQAALFTEMFSTKVRYSGASLGYQLGAVLGGAFAPMIATLLLAKFGFIAISIYIAISCVITIASILLLSETYCADLNEIEKQRPLGGDATPSLKARRIEA